MLKMRLQRVGRKHETSFRLVLTDSKNSTKSGRFKEILGSFDPRKSTEAFDIPRIQHWLEQGIKPTGSVHNLFVTHKIIDAKKKNVLPRKTPIVKESKVESPKVEEAKVEEVKAEESKVESPKVEEAKPAEVKAEEPKVEMKEEAPAEALVEETPAEEVPTK